MNYNFTKRIFDFFMAFVLVVLLWPLLLVLLLLAAIDTDSNGVFLQNRVGQFGRMFNIYKLRTFHKTKHTISPFGAFLRKYKLDELLQLINVLIGNMSFVGPRPDLPGYYDRLQGEERLVLKLKPGITSEASIKYKDEEYVLSQQQNPTLYNDEVIFPDKVKINLNYYYNKGLRKDMYVLFKTVFRF